MDTKSAKKDAPLDELINFWLVDIPLTAKITYSLWMAVAVMFLIIGFVWLSERYAEGKRSREVDRIFLSKQKKNIGAEFFTPLKR